MPDDNTPVMLTPGEVALMARVDRKTVVRWAREGAIPSLSTPGGHYRFRAAAVHAFLARRRPRTAPQRFAPEASARIRYGPRSAAALCKTPRLPDTAVPGAAAIILGVNAAGGMITLETASLEWLDDVESAIQAARARFVVAADLA